MLLAGKRVRGNRFFFFWGRRPINSLRCVVVRVGDWRCESRKVRGRNSTRGAGSVVGDARRRMDWLTSRRFASIRLRARTGRISRDFHRRLRHQFHMAAERQAIVRLAIGGPLEKRIFWPVGEIRQNYRHGRGKSIFSWMWRP